MEDKKRNILFSKEQINSRIEELGKIISEDYKGKNLYVLSLLRGSFVYAADLVRAIDLNVKIGFMTTSSYDNCEISSGCVKVVNDISDNIEGWDSLAHFDLVTEIEEKFEISVAVEDVSRMYTIGDIKITLKKYGIEI